MSNSLDPDQARDLGPNYLQSLSADDTNRQRIKVGMLFGKVNYLGLLDSRTLLPIAPRQGDKSNRLKMANIADWRFVQISINCRTRNFIRIRYPNFNLSFTFSKTPSVCQTFWIQIRPNVLLCMIWAETFCKVYHR